METEIEQGVFAVRKMAPAVSIVIPTRNEAGNIEVLLSRIEQATRNIPIEVIFVDDSTDDTPQVIQELQDRFSFAVGLIARPAERRGNGLAGAVVEGFRMARAPLACVMDSDLQHPPELIPQLLKKIEETGADVVVGSRLARGGDASSLGFRRKLVSYAFATLARLTFPMRLGRVSDPLSGLFILRLEKIDLDKLRPDGFKILLEILTRFPALSVSEIPIRFDPRHAGESKASPREVFRFLRLLVRLRLTGDQHFLQFIAVGASGIVVNSLALAFFTEWMHIYYLISAVLASIVSSSWNFAFIEYWVYRDRQQRRGMLGRLAAFFALNNGALILRGPMIYLLTSVLGVYYILSNLLSLILLVVLRFLFSDQLIWGRGKMKTKQFAYDIHGILTVVSDAVLPELESFRTQTQIAQPSIRVHLGKSPLHGHPFTAAPRENVRRIFYDEGFGNFGFKADIEIGDFVEVWASPFLKWSPHVLYTNLVEPILRWTFVKKGYALVHGACLDFGGRSYLITARTDTGKTTSILKVLSRQRRAADLGAFLSDDLTLVSASGEVLPYPKPLTISHHTVKAINAKYLSFGERLALRVQSRIHSRSGRLFAHFLSKSKLPMATINALVQFLVPPPKYSVQLLVPGVRMAKSGKLNGMFVIERSTMDEELHIGPQQALEILFANCEDAYGFPPYDAIKSFLFTSDGADLRVVEHEIIAQAMYDLPAILVRSNSMNWWRRIPALIDERLAPDFRESVSASSNLRTLPRLRMLISPGQKDKKSDGVVPRRRYSDVAQSKEAELAPVSAGSTKIGLTNRSET
jgi:dolichol-phosphate mannosyltransferase